MIDNAAFNYAVDYVGTACSIYIIFIGIGRLAMMSWETHRRIWQVVYVLLVIWAAGNAMLVFDGKGHVIPIAGMLATCLWFWESRHRWKDNPPHYMERDCTAQVDERGWRPSKDRP
jgi:hypothetical protein